MDTKPYCQNKSKYTRVNLLHVQLDVLNCRDLCDIANRAITGNGKVLLGHHNLHSLYLCETMPSMVQFYSKTDFIHIDGMSLVLLGKLLGLNLTAENRLTCLDWLLPLMTHCQSSLDCRLRVFLLGGEPGVADTAGRAFENQVDKIEVRSHHGFFPMHDPEKNGEILEMINAFQPHLLLVGMGMPRQEEWIVKNADLVQANVVWSLGAFMDYYAGIIPTPPRWLGSLGLEWAYRLYSEPRRLWKRYLWEPWFIARLLMKDLLFKRGIGSRR